MSDLRTLIQTTLDRKGGGYLDSHFTIPLAGGDLLLQNKKYSQVYILLFHADLTSVSGQISFEKGGSNYLGFNDEFELMDRIAGKTPEEVEELLNNLKNAEV